jgi:3-dehydroquinate synthase
MQMAAEVSRQLGWIDAGTTERIEALLERAGLPTRADIESADAIMRLMQLDKKAGRQGLKLILLERLGKGVVCPAPDDAVVRSAIVARLAAVTA